ncbi:Gtr1/RagA G protein conserved region-domain-containing protein [Suillus subalutaceus]|uniref:Gtr1/RagA G protein conserved region-domain-containing protein n=1 Tax=Suillus subalutaceus TaxID=48586 RepID=UPI001B875C29|nr:Gtr1/RagA G protein conserved region-domain-containing protein [Suillus subalutaceus]KAG1830289.1 Gtr1/RagA G protein conserved region-domain-containing protein [Suillus subalutaceus]
MSPSTHSVHLSLSLRNRHTNAQDPYQHPVSNSKLVEFISYTKQKGFKRTTRSHAENFRQIHERVMDHLVDESPEFEQFPLNIHLASIYDHPLREAFSRVLHKLIYSLPYLEELLNVFCSDTASSKAFLFDTSSKIHVATDTSPVDQATHNLCCDYLSMLNSFGPLYGRVGCPQHQHQRPHPQPRHQLPPPAPLLPEHRYSPHRHPPGPPSKPHFYPSAATSLSPSRPGTTLTYHFVTPHLALLALLPTMVYYMRRDLVEWNVVWFREGIREIWKSGLHGASEPQR